MFQSYVNFFAVTHDIIRPAPHILPPLPDNYHRGYEKEGRDICIHTAAAE